MFAIPALGKTWQIMAGKWNI